MSTRQRFRSLLIPDGTNLKWIIAQVPFAPAKVWKTRNRMRVKGTINGFAFRTSLFGSAEKGYVVLVNKTMQKGAQAYVGEMAEFTLEPDLEERSATVPTELAKLLKQDRAVARWFEALSYSVRKYIGDAIRKPKSPAARKRPGGTNDGADDAGNGGRAGAAADPAGRIPPRASGKGRLGGDDAGAAARASARHLLLSESRGTRATHPESD
jgi:Domain of unknown function (DUF1905)/Bacteriocin-protection, YdeI or OmpD-Associated